MVLSDVKVGIVGGGTVGLATARAYAEHVREVIVYDLLPQRGTTMNVRLALESDVVFVCLPEGEVDTFFKRACLDHPSANYVLRSTVPIGTTRGLEEKYGLSNLVHSPEFLTARCASLDAQTPSRNIIGVPPSGQDYVGCLRLLTDVYRLRFPGVQVIWMTSDESEAVKLLTNAFFAVKVAFFNEARSLMDKLGLTWENVRSAMLSDGRINPSHTQVPGPDGRYGFGGACLPKDLQTWIDHMRECGLLNVVSTAAKIRNEFDRARAADIGEIREAISNFRSIIE